MIKTIILDYAGVITPTRDNYVFAQKYQDHFGVKPLDMLDITRQNWDPASLNQIPASDYWEGVAKVLKIAPGELRDMLIETFPIEQRLIDLIDKLRDKYTFVMLSNQIEDWLEKVIDDNDLRGRFDYFVNSYQVGAKKPDKKIFEEVLKRTGTPAEECLFIDDQKKNTSAASELGMQTIIFDTYEQFLDELKKFIPEA